ncbi:MAG: UvrD-helicase domain-containing protein [Gemmatimonadota bacterium]
MTDTEVLTFPLPDQSARERIARDLETNLLVEAGAGSGKTTALVGRMVALIETGTAGADEIAAVTFTRKAAAELRERFQAALESRLLEARAGGVDAEGETELLARALEEIDRVFVGTIHSFCGRLLRERPLDVGLDPAFEELPVEERIRLRRGFWAAYLERMARDSSPLLEELAEAGLSAATLYGLFDTLVENPDVEFPAGERTPPSLSEVGAVRGRLDELVSRAWELMDDLPPAKGWDSFQSKLRRLHFEREITGWSEPTDLFEALATLCKDRRPHTTTLNRWRDKEMAKGLLADVNDFAVGDTPAHALVHRWFAHRYSLALRLCSAAARAFEEHRLRIGKLDFQDLLLLSARLLRENPRVRRQLGRRYRRLLVDEFQDTDPLQAEIILLLSSEPDGEAEADQPGEFDPPVADWRAATPRDGALFVVGDPKQSIYRFRRADIQLYSFVRARFDDFGAVVTLSTNFRSRPAIGDVVNDVFDAADFFPSEATGVQAAFERLDTRPPTEDVPAEGVFTYDLNPERKTKASAAADDGARLASWIRARVDAGEREPGDFLILTRLRPHLDAYARALEARDLPVNVTGAGVGVEEEIRELEVLLECMIDPSNPVKVVSALVGLFFGIDYDRLAEHRLAGGTFDARHPGHDGHEDVCSAIRTLHAWWRASIAEPADVFIGRLVSELGLLPYAASGELGSLRAGALLYALDAVRAAAFGGDTSLTGALTALRAALDLKEAEAPLEPGRPNAVRLMNLHQAKGLEGNVVVLANPTEMRSRVPDAHVSRADDGRALGFLRVSQAQGGFRGNRDLARPEGWAERESAERAFEDAEEVRLLYVAVTRAREELVVSRWPEGRGSSVWAALDPWLDEHATPLELDVVDPAERQPLDVTPDETDAALRASETRLREMATPSFRAVSVTALAKDDANDPVPFRTSEGRERRVYRGYTWGSAVHGALALAASEPGDEALRAACRDLLVEHQRPLDGHGEPVELGELLQLVKSVHASELWVRARRADRTLVEVAFASKGVHGPAPEVFEDVREASAPRGKKQLDLFAAEAVEEETASSLGGPALAEPTEIERESLLEGVVDLAFRETGGWVIADYKTDVGTDPDFPARQARYRRQVDLYADAWSKLTGERVKERILFYIAQGKMESWQ